MVSARRRNRQNMIQPATGERHPEKKNGRFRLWDPPEIFSRPTVLFRIVSCKHALQPNWRESIDQVHAWYRQSMFWPDIEHSETIERIRNWNEFESKESQERKRQTKLDLRIIPEKELIRKVHSVPLTIDRMWKNKWDDHEENLDGRHFRISLFQFS